MWHSWGRGELFAGFLVGMPEGKRLLGRSRRRCEDNIKLDLREILNNVAKSIRLAWDRVRRCKVYFSPRYHGPFSTFYVSI
jgi:hypothetical protein